MRLLESLLQCASDTVISQLEIGRIYGPFCFFKSYVEPVLRMSNRYCICDSFLARHDTHLYCISAKGRMCYLC